MVGVILLRHVYYNNVIILSNGLRNLDICLALPYLSSLRHHLSSLCLLYSAAGAGRRLLSSKALIFNLPSSFSRSCKVLRFLDELDFCNTAYSNNLILSLNKIEQNSIKDSKKILSGSINVIMNILYTNSIYYYKNLFLSYVNLST